MNKAVYFYRTLDQDILKKIDSCIEFEFYYKGDNSLKIPLKILENNDKDILFDDDCDFDNKLDDLFANIKCEIKNTKALFGADSIAPLHSKIGIALEIYSQKSKYRDVSISDIELDYSLNDAVVEFSNIIPKNNIFSELTFNIFLFLKESSKNLLLNEDKYLINVPGVLLGSIQTTTAYFKGNGSLFPIFNASINSKELWQLELTFADPGYEKMSETVCLKLNVNSPNFKYVDVNSNSYCPALINEILVNAITILITELKESYDTTFDYDDANQGSVLEFALYLKNVLKIDFSSPLAISSSLKEYLAKNEVF